MSERLIREVTQDVHRDVDRFVRGADGAVSRLASGLRQEVALGDRNAIAAELYALLTEEPDVDWMFFGNEAGGVVSVGRLEDASVVFRMTDELRAGVLREFEALPGGRIGRLRKSEGAHDTRQRPWYAQAKETGKRYWTEPLLGSVRPILGISLSAPVFNKDGNLVGAVGISFTLAQLSRFLHTLEIGDRGRAFIVDGTGHLIGASGGVSPVVISADGRHSRLYASWAADPIVRETARHLGRHPDIAGSSSSGPRVFSFDDPERGRIYAAVDRFEAPGEIKWTIVSAVPASDFLGPVYRAAYLSAAIATLIVAVLLVLGGWLVGRTLRPLTALTQTAQGIAKGEWRDLPEVRRKDEVGLLAQAFTHMTGRLKETLDGLRRSEAKFEEAQRVAHVGYWERDLHTDRITWSDETYRIYGLTPGDTITPAGMLERIHPEDLPKWRQAVEKARRGTSRYELEYRVVRPSGVVRVVHSQGDVARDASGRPRSMFGAVQDITDRKRAEEHKGQLASIVESSDDAIVSKDLNGVIGTWNRGAERLFGYRSEEVVGKPITLLMPPDREAEEAEILERIRRGERVEHFETVRRHKDGSLVDVSLTVSPIKSASGGIIGASKIARDITERKRVEEALRQREKELRDIVETIPGMAGTLSPDGLVAFVNRRWTEYTGLSAEDSAGWGWRAALHPDDRERHAQKWLASAASRELFENEARFRRAADGKYRWFLVRIEPLRDEQGNVLNWYGILTDIEDRKRAEQALSQSQAYLAEAQRLTHTGSWAWDAGSHKRRYWSEEMFRIYGLDPQRSSPEEAVRFWHPEDRDRIMERVETACREKADFALDHRIVLSDGTVKHLHVIGQPVLNEAGEVRQLVGTAMDVTERKRADDELRASEARFRAIVDHATDAFFLYGEDATVLDVNREACESLGYSRDELIGMSAFDYGPELTPAVLQRIQERLRSGKIVTYEGRHRRKDGTVFPAEVRIREFRHGGRMMALSLVRDITKRKQAEEELRASEARFRTFVDHASDAFFLCSEDATVLDVNREACESLGYSRDELIGMTPLDFDPEATPARLQQTRERLDAGQIVTREGHHRRKDGTVFPVEVRLRRFPHAGRSLRLVLVRDITERKRAEAERDRAEYLTRQVFDTSPERIAIVARDYRYRRINPAFERYWRMPAERIMGMHVSDLFGIEVFEQTLKPKLDRCFAGEEVTYGEWFTTSRGRAYIAGTYSPLRLDTERVEAVLVIARDLTEQMLASEGLRAAQAELAHVNRVTTMGQLTASIAHEVNQPIAAAVTNAQAALRWLRAQPPDPVEVRQALDRIVENGNRAGEVIGRIRALIKKAPARKDNVAINDAILEVVALTGGEAVKNGVSVQTQLADGLPLIQGDRVQLQQVILNLIINAIEAMSETGEGSRDLLISTEKAESDGVLAAVRDSGPGLAPAALEHVFEAFYTTKPDGLGMGLSICRSIIEAHGGRLWAGANVPRGAVFQFTLPANPDI